MFKIDSFESIFIYLCYNIVNFWGINMGTIYLTKPELQRDIDFAIGVLNKKIRREFSWIYGNTNEDLEFVFESVDVSDKNILTVLSSSEEKTTIFKSIELW